MKTAIVIGSTGLVGSHLVEQLSASAFYSKIILLNRRHVAFQNAKVEEYVIDFEKPDLTCITGDDVFCAIGTTLKKAGSKAVQFKIDCEYPSILAQLLRAKAAKQFVLVSSIGANPNSSNFYLRTKGQLEERLKNLNFDSCIVLRPSFILGHRKEVRLGEKMGIVLMKLLGPLMLGKLKKYRGVAAASIAAKMIHAANQNFTGFLVIESDKIRP